MSDELVTMTEAAQLLGTTREKVARLVRQGVLTSRPSVLDARRRLIPRTEVEGILNSEGRHVSTQESDSIEKPRRLRPLTAAMYTSPLAIQSDEV